MRFGRKPKIYCSECGQKLEIYNKTYPLRTEEWQVATCPERIHDWTKLDHTHEFLKYLGEKKGNFDPYTGKPRDGS